MAKKNKNVPHEEQKSAAEYYKLNTKAVDDLVTATKENSPIVPKEELRKYKANKKSIPNWLKVVFIKFWFSGAVCFFFLWGLGYYIHDQLDLLFVNGIALGVVTDLLTNNVLRFIEETPGANSPWMMFPKKRFISFFLNILYAFVILFCEFLLYNEINLAIVTATGATDTVPLGVEPILFGIFYLVIDLIFLGVKQVFVRIIEDAKAKVDQERHS
ncbi:MAG: hypothetical protein II642_01910 [Firmicutes bacterium]|nr:hypothetical protein [Bacillota bacterium]